MNQVKTKIATKKIVEDQTNWFQKIIRLLKYVKNPWITWPLIIFISLALVASLIAGTYLVGVSLAQVTSSINDQFGTNIWPQLLPVIGGMIASYVISGVFGIAMAIVTMTVSQNIGYQMRRDLFSKLHSIPFDQLDKKQHGDLLSRLTNDVSAITASISESSSVFFQGIIQVIAISIFLFFISPIIAAVVVVLMPILFMVILIILKKGMPYFTKQQETIGDVSTFSQSYYSGHKVIKSFNYTDLATKDFFKVNEINQKVEDKALWISGSIFPYGNFVSNLLVVIVILLAAILPMVGVSYYTSLNSLKTEIDLSNGSREANPLIIMGLFILFLRQATSAISQILAISSQLQRMIAGSERVYEILDTKDEEVEILSIKAKKLLKHYFELQRLKLNNFYATKKINREEYLYQTEKMNAILAIKPKEGELGSDLLNVTKAYVKIQNINFSYEPGKPILKNVSFEALPGSSNAIVGKTGSGKTTFISLLVRFYELNSGRILIDDQDISKVPRDSLRSNITIVLQDSFLFQSSIRENIRHGNPKATEAEIIAAAKMSNAWFFIKQLPEGLDTIVTNNSGLSEGQKQLLSISRAFLSKAKIIILDEATSYVDTKTEKQIQEGMARLMKGRTSFIIAHRLSTIKNSDNIVVMDDGKIIEQGTHSQLLGMKGLYSKLNESYLIDEN